MVKHSILTQRERQIMDKKIKGTSLTQNESNILSKVVRPKLREISKISAITLLNKLEYNQKAKSIENKLRELVLRNIKNVKAIILYGSAIQTNYKEYNDIDVLVVTKDKDWNTIGDKYDSISKLTKIAKDAGLNADIQLVDKKSFEIQYPHNPSLIYQLKDSKIIHGAIKIPSKRELSKLDLRMKLDWSDIDDEESSSSELYQSFRNIVLVRLLLHRIINNELLREEVIKELGEKLVAKLKNNAATKLERKLALHYIRKLSEETDKEIRESKWEKIVL